jgi:protein N-terminal methyltransferase
MDTDSDPPPPTSAPDSAINQDHALEYWNSISSDINGMLGGYPQTSRIDLQGSSNFLTKLRRGKTAATKQSLQPLDRVADCGAGIGRIAKGLLMGVGKSVDIVEPVKKFTDEFVAGLGEAEKGKVGEVINLGLQDWIPEPGAYNLIWNQWCLGHLTDAQLIVYLRRCRDGLVKLGGGGEEEGIKAREGWIVVKENMSTDIRREDIFDEEDSSVTRSDEKFRALFKDAGLKVVAQEVQKGFPRELYPVRMYALKPE